MFYLLFIIVWIAIITLAKDKIKIYIKKFFNITPKPSSNTEPSHIFSDIHSEYVDFKNTLNLNIISIKDQLALQKPQKKKSRKNNIEYKEIHDSDVTEEIYEEEEDDDLDFYQIFKKALKILGKLFKSIYRKIKKFITNNIKL